MKSYNFTNCKPLNTKDIQNKDVLWNEYNRLLQKEGDIEAWEPYNLKTKKHQLRFTKRLYWHFYNNDKAHFLRVQQFQSEYFRIIQIFCHHGSVKPEYKEPLLQYTESGSLAEASRKFPTVTVRRLSYYLDNKFESMKQFVYTFEQELENE